MARVALIGLAMALLFACGPGEDAVEERPTEAAAGAGSPAEWPTADLAGSAAGANLLLVTLDTTRADRLGCYGREGAATPTLDALAARGVRFADAVSPVPMTLPAHATVMTGLDPPGHGVRVNGAAPLEPERWTLAEALGDAGYRTAAFVSSFVLDGRYGLDQGFDTYDATLEASRAGSLEPQTERSATAVTDAALAWLESEASGDAPIFLWVHYFDPHDPYEPPEPFAGRFRERPYEGEIAYVDRELGRLVAALPDETLVVAAGDHGESLGEHGERFHSRTLYEGAVRVPLILAPPAGTVGAVGAVVEAPVTLADLAPTVLDLLGLGEDEAAFDGRSLVEAGEEGRTLYLETLNPWYDNGWAPLYAARTSDRKYIRAPRPELYDLEVDPDESRNLLPGGEDARESAERLAAFVAERAPEEGGDLASATGSGEGVDPEVRRRLESLGYLTPGRGESRDLPPEELPDPKDMLPLLEDLSEGRRSLAAGRPAEAERSARRILSEAPRDRAALQLLAESYATRGRVEDAERALRRSVEVGPTVGACVLLAQVVMQQRRFDEAEALLDRAAEIDPRHGAVLLARGDLALVRGRPAEALERYREAGEADPYRFGRIAEGRIARIRPSSR